MKTDDPILLSDGERNRQFNELCEQAMKLGFLVTDFVSTEMIMDDYELTFDQAMEVLPLIDLADYDDNCISANAGSQDGRRDVLDAAVKDAGFSQDDEDDEDDEDDDTLK